MDWATQTDDVALYLSQNKDTDVTHTLQERFAVQRSATFIGSNNLLVLGSQDGNGQKYAAVSEQKFVDDNVNPLAPHVLQIASDAFNQMINKKQDQTVFFIGTSGAGKSQNRMILSKQLIDIAKNGKKKSKVLSGAAKMEPVLDAFGAYKSTTSVSASALGRYTEYQYNDAGRMVGIKLLDYGLNKGRVTNGQSLLDGERPFNIFYQLLAGATAEEKQSLFITDPSIFVYTKGAHAVTQTLSRSGTLGRKLTLGRSKSIGKKPVAVAASADATPTTEDAQRFEVLRDNLKSLGVGKRIQSQIFKVLAAILHLGNLIFVDDDKKPNDACTIKNLDTLHLIAQLLGVSSESLQNTILYKSKMMGTDTFSSFLKADGASDQRDALAQVLYSLLFTWIIEHLNERLCKPEAEVDCTIGVLDFPWFQESQAGTPFAKLDTFYYNYCQERLMHYIHTENFDRTTELFNAQGISIISPDYPDNQSVIDLYEGTTRIPGLFSLLDKASALDVPADSTVAKEMVANLDSTLKPNPNFIPSAKCASGMATASGSPKSLFGIKHYLQGPSVDYDVDSFLDDDSAMTDFVSLFRGSTAALNVEKDESEISFVASLFSKQNGIQAVTSGKSGRVSGAKKSNEPLRQPSMKRKKKKADSPPDEKVLQFSSGKSSVETLCDAIKDTQHWNIFCISPSATPGGVFDASRVKEQLALLNIRELAAFKAQYDVDLADCITYDAFIKKYGSLLSTSIASRGGAGSIDQVKQFINSQYWPAREVAYGNTMLFLSASKWRWVEHAYGRINRDVNLESRSSGNYTASDQGSEWEKVRGMAPRDEDMFSEAESNMDSEYNFADDPRGKNAKTKKDIELGKNADIKPELHQEIIDRTEEITRSRKCWVCCTWFLTWWIPSPFLSWCGGMKRPDIRMAWREKVALCIIIFFMCCALLFIIIGMRYIICPEVPVLTQSEVQAKSSPNFGSKTPNPWVSAYGRYFYVGDLMNNHEKTYGVSALGPTGIQNFRFEQFYGNDVSNLFFLQDSWANLCKGIPVPTNKKWDNLDSTITWMNRANVPQAFQTTHRQLAPNGLPQQYLGNMYQYAKGRIGWSTQTISAISSESKIYIILFDNVYYTSTMQTLGKGIFDDIIMQLFGPNNQGKDITKQWKQLRATNTNINFDDTLSCINNMFYIGTVDRRDTIQCRVSNYLLFGSSILLVAVIGVKFLAALQFGAKHDPELADKFVILMVPCYTEGVESLTKTIDSLSTLKYDDKRKLLVVICDGMIIGSGNDRPTPRIVLDILGVDHSQNPEALPFNSLGDGSKQFNMGKVYSGLYEIRGHSVPFIVIVKCGSPTERSKPGNRGKRDSQLVLMRFLNRVHFNSEFSPMELELYHQMKNIIGVSPSFYEFILMVDADTEVEASGLNRMVSVMVNDTTVMGLCGETKIANEKDSWVTMIQVYEYFISHHLAKQFESLFGSVTCLPGCFSMYRIRSASKNIPVLVAPSILADYAENTVDTLHKQNLLHLGEDRYLTTLLLKHFPRMKTKFAAEARCFTVAPDRWAVLLSQRRRWINSTVHNLLELILLEQLCGFCCFSMRFIVMLDLFATFVQPATILYIGYLVYAAITSTEQFPLLSIILIAAIYGLQVIIFVLKREWQHIAWMFIYLLAMPIISFWIPCYSFWHFDDFSWGNTRVVVGEGKKTVYLADTEPFDPKSIPMKRWRDFEENDLWEQESVVSGSSFQSSVRSQGMPPVMGDDFTASSVYDGPTNPRHLSMVSYGNSPSPVGAGVPGPYPSNNGVITDEQLFFEIKQSLVGADLMTLTKKQIRDNLSAKLGVDLKPRKEQMNRMIDEILLGKM
ncbi:hypothetical protein HDV04_005533 [Boothiomyces sp. JEL0838]|nr:hypothetical protein HDV04_005533 [Boothiomyces sp. JEL0838]